jgi:hypothetical protein
MFYGAVDPRYIEADKRLAAAGSWNPTQPVRSLAQAVFISRDALLRATAEAPSANRGFLAALVQSWAARYYVEGMSVPNVFKAGVDALTQAGAPKTKAWLQGIAYEYWYNVEGGGRTTAATASASAPASAQTGVGSTLTALMVALTGQLPALTAKRPAQLPAVPGAPPPLAVVPFWSQPWVLPTVGITVLGIAALVLFWPKAKPAAA